MRKEYRLAPVLLKEKLDERLKAGLDKEESDRILNQMIQREIIIEENLDLSHLDYLGKTLEEFKQNMNENNIAYIKNDLLMDKLVAFLTKNNTLE